MNLPFIHLFLIFCAGVSLLSVSFFKLVSLTIQVADRIFKKRSWSASLWDIVILFVLGVCTLAFSFASFYLFHVKV